MSDQDNVSLRPHKNCNFGERSRNLVLTPTLSDQEIDAFIETLKPRLTAGSFFEPGTGGASPLCAGARALSARADRDGACPPDAINDHTARSTVAVGSARICRRCDAGSENGARRKGSPRPPAVISVAIAVVGTIAVGRAAIPAASPCGTGIPAAVPARAPTGVPARTIPPARSVPPATTPARPHPGREARPATSPSGPAAPMSATATSPLRLGGGWHARDHEPRRDHCARTAQKCLDRLEIPHERSPAQATPNDQG